MSIFSALQNSITLPIRVFPTYLPFLTLIVKKKCIDNMEIGYEFQGTTCRGYDPSRVRLGKHPRREGTRRESRISGTCCRGYEFAGVRLVQLPLHLYHLSSQSFVGLAFIDSLYFINTYKFLNLN